MTSETYGPFIQKLSVAARQVRPADRTELAAVVVLLFTAIRTCHAAYLRYKNSDDSENYYAWGESIRGLQIAISNVDTTLRIFAPEVFTGVRAYFSVEAVGHAQAGDESIRMLEDGLRLADWDPQPVDYQKVLDALSAFIRDTFTMEEIFRASSDSA